MAAKAAVAAAFVVVAAVAFAAAVVVVVVVVPAAAAVAATAPPSSRPSERGRVFSLFYPAESAITAYRSTNLFISGQHPSGTARNTELCSECEHRAAQD